jgi:hypothetical protein
MLQHKIIQPHGKEVPVVLAIFRVDISSMLKNRFLEKKFVVEVLFKNIIGHGFVTV